jgi:hypothetical protein
MVEGTVTGLWPSCELSGRAQWRRVSGGEQPSPADPHASAADDTLFPPSALRLWQTTPSATTGSRAAPAQLRLVSRRTSRSRPAAISSTRSGRSRPRARRRPSSPPRRRRKRFVVQGRVRLICAARDANGSMLVPRSAAQVPQARDQPPVDAGGRRRRRDSSPSVPAGPSLKTMHSADNVPTLSMF